MSRNSFKAFWQKCLLVLSFAIVVLLGWRWLDLSESQGHAELLGQQILDKLGDRLPRLEPFSFAAVLGRIPNPAEIELGRMLFNDPILARNNDASCATCHLSNHGFADGNPLSIGALGRGGPSGDDVGAAFGQGVLSTERSLGQDGMGHQATAFMFRNSLSTVNVAYRMDRLNDSGLLHDGRFGDIEFQVLLPIHTAEELCGSNPVPADKQHSLFQAGGHFFSKSIVIEHAHGFDAVTGSNSPYFHVGRQTIAGIPSFRPNGTLSVPTRNECLALAVAKISHIPGYRQLFRQAFGDDRVDDRRMGMALAAFIMTHVALDTPYDRFLKGQNALSSSELQGLAMFMTPVGENIEFAPNLVLPGTGCFNCHSGGTFGGTGFAALGVRSDPRSSLSRPKDVFPAQSAFFVRPKLQRGRVPRCLIEGVTVAPEGNYAPDIGRANGSFVSDDCFKFRIPPLRNVIETYPYFHHGTARGQGIVSTRIEQMALQALRDVIRYHLQGPLSKEQFDRRHITRVQFDRFLQWDPLVPYFRQNFLGIEPIDNSLFPLTIEDEHIEALTRFVAYGLWDRSSVRRGLLGNDVSHPRRVPSGFTPTISRDAGHQLELPPAYRDTVD